jgi:hypothetical protein
MEIGNELVANGSSMPLKSLMVNFIDFVKINKDTWGTTHGFVVEPEKLH